jgi:hypothetical protein
MTPRDRGRRPGARLANRLDRPSREEEDDYQTDNELFVFGQLHGATWQLKAID